MKVLVTGGLGYIGSTICSALIDKGHTPVIIDSLVNGSESFILDRIFYKGDIKDESLVDRIFEEHPGIQVVIHCAALIIVPESVSKPFKYYQNNISKTITFLNSLLRNKCNKIIFSSSASIYDKVDNFKVDETSPTIGNCPYARTKIMTEQILDDFSKAYDLSGLALRYFNPIGVDPKMRTGSYIEKPSHVLAKLMEVYFEKEEIFNITGCDWDTKDGTAIRDYVHVWDIAIAHVLAVEKFDSVIKSEKSNFSIINLGTGNGMTVLEILQAFERVIKSKLNSQKTGPRPGDSIGAYANNDKAKKMLGWEIKYSLESAINDALTWEKMKDKVFKSGI